MKLMNIGEETTLVPQDTTVSLMESISEVATEDTSGVDKDDLTAKEVILDDCLTPLLENLPKEITESNPQVIGQLMTYSSNQARI